MIQAFLATTSEVHEGEIVDSATIHSQFISEMLQMFGREMLHIKLTTVDNSPPFHITFSITPCIR